MNLREDVRNRFRGTRTNEGIINGTVLTDKRAPLEVVGANLNRAGEPGLAILVAGVALVNPRVITDRVDKIVAALGFRIAAGKTVMDMNTTAVCGAALIPTQIAFHASDMPVPANSRGITILVDSDNSFDIGA